MAHSTTHAAEPAAGKALVLPMQVTSPIEIGRLLRELENINESLLQLQLRKPGADVVMPKSSQMLEQLVQLNGLNLLQEDDRTKLQIFLKQVKDAAPTMHMSFSADPSVQFMEKIMAWLRREIHPLTLVTIGLQPSIGAGCVIRTTNRQFDLSLKQSFMNKRDLLRDQIALQETKA